MSILSRYIVDKIKEKRSHYCKILRHLNEMKGNKFTCQNGVHDQKTKKVETMYEIDKYHCLPHILHLTDG